MVLPTSKLGAKVDFLSHANHFARSLPRYFSRSPSYEI